MTAAMRSTAGFTVGASCAAVGSVGALSPRMSKRCAIPAAFAALRYALMSVPSPWISKETSRFPVGPTPPGVRATLLFGNRRDPLIFAERLRNSGGTVMSSSPERIDEGYRIFRASVNSSPSSRMSPTETVTTWEAGKRYTVTFVTTT